MEGILFAGAFTVDGDIVVSFDDGAIAVSPTGEEIPLSTCQLACRLVDAQTFE